jgi:hypothetical protein
VKGREVYQQFLDSKSHALRSHRRYDAMRETVAFMLENAVGAQNAVSTERIVAHLQGADYDLTAPQWQVEVLGPLRDNGVFICGGRGGVGMFLVDSAADGQKALAAMKNRVATENRRLRVLEAMLAKID